jgi:vacuolar-type H+-ATPase subunit E/Vma4
MSRATGLERIEKLRLQLEEAEAKAAAAEAKKAEAEAEKVAKKRATLQAKLGRLETQQDHVVEMIEATLKELDSLPEEPSTPQLAFEASEPADDDVA